jgi:hypothetical protein
LSQIEKPIAVDVFTPHVLNAIKVKMIHDSFNGFSPFPALLLKPSQRLNGKSFPQNVSFKLGESGPEKSAVSNCEPEVAFRFYPCLDINAFAVIPIAHFRDQFVEIGHRHVSPSIKKGRSLRTGAP